MPKTSEKFIRYALGILLLLVAINAFAGGYYGMAGAKNIPMEWLKNSPFHNYFIPSLILFIVIGGSSLFAAVTVFRRDRFGRKASLLCGVIILIWLGVQIAIIGYVSWMQPATAIATVLIIFLSFLIPEIR
jgi:MFS family permease